MGKKTVTSSNLSLLKKPTGINGIDEITFGGLPEGRPTLLCGSPGCGKTLMATQFLVNGAMQFNEPGLFVSFEETECELITNASSLDFNLQKLIDEKKLAIEHIFIDRNEFEEAVSSLMDTWILLQSVHANGENNRIISVLKSRGMKHSNQIREMLITNNGIDFTDVYLGKGKVLTGSARITQQAIESQQEINQNYEIKHKQCENLYKVKTIEAQISALQLELAMTKDDIQHAIIRSNKLEKLNKNEQKKMSSSRMADKLNIAAQKKG
ncbi:ATPase domain-containing protein [Legionella jamestowniensis]|uniref:DNA integration/recombination/inversion protein n=1 Tax=Legionella jamestowniensis TaxID=455 RepID=A0A0W0V028_9GAMM|nr:ATPase domain-containing protein [Legionella jamestowniensis]KTD13277.1 DNA integration/recombination/inversion protein [Legionella jamestowniensis]OCH98305.1 hypothetical protein A8135_12170 [Legionella jamestowniensis]SFL77752.1 KaiC protein [Legionella jamestowniensis DSM 19215]